MNIPLTLHLVGAVLSAGLIIASIVALVGRRAMWLRPLARSVAVAGVYQIVTGAVLSYVSHASVLSFCARVGSYVAILALAELLLVIALKRSERKEAHAPSKAAPQIIGR